LSEPYYNVIRPHGGVLVDRVLRGEVREAVRERAERMVKVRAERMVKVPLGRMGLSDLELLATGALSPLTGFMLKADYDRCVEEMRLANGLVWSIPVTLARLANGLVWSIPVTLAVEQDMADRVREGQEVALCEGERVLAVMEVAEKYP